LPQVENELQAFAALSYETNRVGGWKTAVHHVATRVEQYNPSSSYHPEHFCPFLTSNASYHATDLRHAMPSLIVSTHSGQVTVEKQTFRVAAWSNCSKLKTIGLLKAH